MQDEFELEAKQDQVEGKPMLGEKIVLKKTGPPEYGGSSDPY